MLLDMDESRFVLRPEFACFFLGDALLSCFCFLRRFLEDCCASVEHMHPILLFGAHCSVAFGEVVVIMIFIEGNDKQKDAREILPNFTQCRKQK